MPRFAAPLLGAAPLVFAILAGADETVRNTVLSPPLALRFVLGSIALVLGANFVLRSAEQVGASSEPRELIRGVRLVFLAVAAFAAAAGWFLGSPVPIVAALVIAGVDVLETSLLLFVTAVRQR